MEVNNKYLAFCWDRFDFPIRFVYCRANLFSKILFWKLYASDIESLDETFEDMLAILKDHSVSVKNKSLLELGPGNSYILAYNFLAHDAKKIILVDKYPRIVDTKKQKDHFKKEIDHIKSKYGKDPFLIKGQSIDQRYLEYLPRDLVEVTHNQVDFIYSNSVLEHIKDIRENIAAMSRILRNGGHMYHNIDLRDHYNFNNPFLFYKYEDTTWNKYLTKGGVSYTNRLRYDDFTQLFKTSGFEIVHETTQRGNLNQQRISSSFKEKNKDALEIVKLSVLVRKTY
jgi:SAM-dependent methyltransferase